MVSAYEVQGRRIERDSTTRRLLRNDVRLISASNSDAAFREAEKLVAEGFTAWVFRTIMEAGVKRYSLLGVQGPSRTG
jgi:hypothetical protein